MTGGGGLENWEGAWGTAPLFTMFLSDEGPTLETLDFIVTVSAVHQPFSSSSQSLFGCNIIYPL